MRYFLTAIVLLLGTLLPAHSMMPPQQTAATGEPLTWNAGEVAKLIDECGRRTTQMTGRLYNSTFHATDTDYVLDKQGRVKSEQSKDFEVYPTHIGNFRKWIYVQVGENGHAF